MTPAAGTGAGVVVSGVAPGPHRAYLEAMSDTAPLSAKTLPTLTPAAAARVRWIAGRQGNASPQLRLSVEGGGCAGFSYRFALADAVDADDIVIEGEGASLVVDPTSLEFLAGAAVDFVQSLGGSAFRVTNPQAASGCGCGSSFSI